MVVSCAFSPPSIIASPPSRVVAPAPLVARGRSGSRTQDEFSKLKQSTRVVAGERPPATHTLAPKTNPDTWLRGAGREGRICLRSEEHTSELQSHLNLVCRLLLEKKNAPRPLPTHRRRPALP